MSLQNHSPSGTTVPLSLLAGNDSRVVTADANAMAAVAKPIKSSLFEENI
jgi:hypothetical protein